MLNMGFDPHEILN